MNYSLFKFLFLQLQNFDVTPFLHSDFNKSTFQCGNSSLISIFLTTWPVWRYFWSNAYSYVCYSLQWISYPLNTFWYYHILWKYIGAWIQKRGLTLATGWTSDQLVAETSTWQHTTLATDIHASGGIRTHNLGRPVTADPLLRPRGHWDRQINLLKAGN
jgi:hypothetical protein